MTPVERKVRPKGDMFNGKTSGFSSSSPVDKFIYMVILPNKKTRGVMTKLEKPMYAAKAKVLKALGHPTRLWMAEQLADGEKCVCELVEPLGVDFSTVSKHLSVLKEAGLVEVDKRGKQVFYSLKVPCILNFMGCVEAVLENNAKEQMGMMNIE